MACRPIGRFCYKSVKLFQAPGTSTPGPFEAATKHVDSIKACGAAGPTPPPPLLRRARGGVLGDRLLVGWLLVDAEDVAGGISEAGGDFGVVASDGLGDLASGGGDGLDCCGGIVDHDVDEEARIDRWLAVEDPGAADLAGGVVKGCAPVASLADVPAKDGLVELGGVGDVDRWNF